LIAASPYTFTNKAEILQISSQTVGPVFTGYKETLDDFYLCNCHYGSFSVVFWCFISRDFFCPQAFEATVRKRAGCDFLLPGLTLCSAKIELIFQKN
jgi:hypothetical protein